MLFRSSLIGQTESSYVHSMYGSSMYAFRADSDGQIAVLRRQRSIRRSRNSVECSDSAWNYHPSTLSPWRHMEWHFNLPALTRQRTSKHHRPTVYTLIQCYSMHTHYTYVLTTFLQPHQQYCKGLYHSDGSFTDIWSDPFAFDVLA